MNFTGRLGQDCASAVSGSDEDQDCKQQLFHSDS